MQIINQYLMFGFKTLYLEPRILNVRIEDYFLHLILEKMVLMDVNTYATQLFVITEWKQIMATDGTVLVTNIDAELFALTE